MIATLDEKGVLTVKAENGTEAYALRKWNDGLMAGFGRQDSVLACDWESYAGAVMGKETKCEQ